MKNLVLFFALAILVSSQYSPRMARILGLAETAAYATKD